MLPTSASFQDYRLQAARSFAQTMIVVDDEATQASPEDRITKLRVPRRIGRPAVPDSAATPKPDAPSTHALDAKTLIDNAMDLGLICSVLRPRKGENVRRRVKRVAQSA